MATVAGPASAQLGSPNLEPYLRSRDDVIFFEDYEAANFYLNWGESSLPSNCGRTSAPLFAGSNSLRVTVPTAQHTGLAWQWNFASFGLAEPEEVYFRYYMYLGDSWRLPGGGEVGKLPGPAGTYGIAGWGGRPSHGNDGWSARMSDFDRGDSIELSYYCYHADMTGSYGSNWTWGSDARLQRGRWYCVETYVKMNSITGTRGNNDGILRGWVDGQPVFEKTDIRFRDVSRLKVQGLWFNVYVGGEWTAAQDMNAYFDNVVFARDYIGPLVLPGDTDLDGDVDFSDYQTLEVNFRTGSTWGQGNFDDDGDVDFADYQKLEVNFGHHIPEPAVLATLALGGLAALRRRNRRRVGVD